MTPLERIDHIIDPKHRELFRRAKLAEHYGEKYVEFVKTEDLMSLLAALEAEKEHNAKADEALRGK